MQPQLSLHLPSFISFIRCPLRSLSSVVLCVHFELTAMFSFAAASAAILVLAIASASVVDGKELRVDHVREPPLTSHCWQAFWISVRMPAHRITISMCISR
jgi:hypothetical protein